MNSPEGPSMTNLTKVLYRSLWEDVLTIPLASFKRSLHNLAQALARRSCEDPGEVLSKRVLRDLVQFLVRRSCGTVVRPSLRGPCVKILEVLVSRSCMILSSSSRPFTTISRDSLRGPGMKILFKAFYKSLWEALLEILVKSSKRSLHDLVQVLVRRSCENLWKSSSRGPCSKILKKIARVLVWKFFWDAPRKFLYEDLVKSSI